MTKRKHNGPGYVYVFRLGEYHKIGLSKSPNRRFTAFTCTPYEFELIALIRTENMRQMEAGLHIRFSSKRVQGEWFRLSEQDVASLRAMGTAPVSKNLDCKTVKIDADLFRKICLIVAAEDNGENMSDYLEKLLREPVFRDFEQAVKEIQER